MLLAALDSSCLVLSGFYGLLLRFDGTPQWGYVATWLRHMVLAVPLYITIYYCCGLYNRVWSYAPIQDQLRVVVGVSLATLLLAGLVIVSPLAFPLSVVAMSWFFNLAVLSASRILARLRKDSFSKRPGKKGPKTLIIGAGDAGNLLAREIYKHSELDFDLIGFLDDDYGKIGSTLGGVRVLGSLAKLEEAVATWGIKAVIIAIPSASVQLIKDLTRRCNELGIKPKTVPGLFEILSGRRQIAQVRDVQIEDLLPRQKVEIDYSEIRNYLEGRIVLISGAGGSIGSELCRQTARCNPASLLLLGHGENSIYRIHRELNQLYPHLPLIPLIADVRDVSRLHAIFAKHRPQVVFHAAAHKHVPLMEQNPEEVITNNVLGTRAIAQAAHQFGAERFVMLSTDKAVNPSSAMGASKRLAELILQSLDGQSTTRYMAVRFGNVLGSRGSVVPLFQEQIASGGPVTITHPEMTRYFMTIPEAVGLVLQAGAMGQGGEVFILEMGEPVRICDLVHDLIRLSGFTPDVDIPISFVGERAGEKLHEELVAAHEDARPTVHPQIMAIQQAAVSRQALQTVLHELTSAQGAGCSVSHLLALVNRLTPSAGSSSVAGQAGGNQ